MKRADPNPVRNQAGEGKGGSLALPVVSTLPVRRESARCAPVPGRRILLEPYSPKEVSRPDAPVRISDRRCAVRLDEAVKMKRQRIRDLVRHRLVTRHIGKSNLGSSVFAGANSCRIRMTAHPDETSLEQLPKIQLRISRTPQLPPGFSAVPIQRCNWRQTPLSPIFSTPSGMATSLRFPFFRTHDLRSLSACPETLRSSN